MTSIKGGKIAHFTNSSISEKTASTPDAANEKKIQNYKRYRNCVETDNGAHNEGSVSTPTSTPAASARASKLGPKWSTVCNSAWICSNSFILRLGSFP